MKATFYRSLAPVAFASLIAAGCGQKPSFQEKESTESGAHGRIDDVGNSEDATNPNGVGVPNGDDPTAGDKEGNDDQTGGMDAGGTDGAADGGTMDAGSDGDIPDPNGNDSDKPRQTMTREMSFPTHVLGSADVTKDLDKAYLTQDMTLQRLYYDKAKQVDQITRPQANDQFDQGYAGASNTEMFDQVANRLLDILVVVDNSNSMKQEQDNLATKLQPLLSSVQDSDWQIGVVTTDPDQGALRSLIKKGEANAAAKFASAVTAGTMGSNNERGVLQAVRSLSGYNMPSTWVRNDSNIAILLVTDEDNCSDGRDCPGKAYAEGKYLYDYLASVRNPGQNARVYGILWHASQTQDDCPTALNQAKIYSQLIADTKGDWGSICDDDYTATLQKISKNIMVSLNSRFTLKYQPDPGTLKVYFNSTEITTGYTVNGKVVEFNLPPPEGTKVTFNYKYGAQPVKASFPLKFKPLVDQLYVTVNGQVASTNDYSYNAATQSIDFKVAPVERAKISAVYTRDVPLTTEFQVGDVIKAGSLTVYVNGAQSMDYTVQEPTGTIKFNKAPAEGAKISFTYVAVGSPIYAYPFRAPYGTPVDLYIYDTVTQAAIRFLYAAGVVTIHPLDYVEGRGITLRYDNVGRQKFDVMLPNTPVASSVKALGGPQVCTGAPYIVVTGTNVNVDGCGFSDDVTQVKVSYDYVVAAYEQFTFAVDNLPKPDEYQEWKVYVNGRLTTDYVRSGNVIKFNSALPGGSTVKITLTQQVY